MKTIIAIAFTALAGCGTELAQVVPDAGSPDARTVAIPAADAKQGCFGDAPSAPCPADTLPEFTVRLDAYEIDAAQSSLALAQGDAEAACVTRGGHLPAESQYEHALALGFIAAVPPGHGEWTRDWYAANYYASAPSADPTGPATGQVHTVRGGTRDWYDRVQPGSDALALPFRCAFGW